MYSIIVINYLFDLNATHMVIGSRNTKWPFYRGISLAAPAVVFATLPRTSGRPNLFWFFTRYTYNPIKYNKNRTADRSSLAPCDLSCDLCTPETSQVPTRQIDRVLKTVVIVTSSRKPENQHPREGHADAAMRMRVLRDIVAASTTCKLCTRISVGRRLSLGNSAYT